MKKITEELAVLLASYQVFYTNVHGFHWNIIGEKFMEAHAVFGDLYDYIGGPIDTIAERIRVLGEFPTHKMTDYLKQTLIPEATHNTSDWKSNVLNIQQSLRIIITQLEEIDSVASAQEDCGTQNLIQGLVETTQKKLWFFESYLPTKNENMGAKSLKSFLS